MTKSKNERYSSKKKILILIVALIAGLIACFAAITVLLTIFMTFIDWFLSQEEHGVKLTFIEELTGSAILTEQLFTKALFTVMRASISGIEISDEISEFVVTMTKKQKRTLFRKLFICGVLLFLIGSVFNVHEVGYNDWRSDNGITLIYSGFKLCLLNKRLAFFEISSVWYFLFDFILGVFRLIGLTFVAGITVLGLRDNLQEHRCIKKQKWMLFICGTLLFLIGSVFSCHIGNRIVTDELRNDIHYAVETYELLFLNKPFISKLSLQWFGFFDFILGALRQLGLIFAIVTAAFCLWERKENKSIIKKDDYNEA